MCAPFIEADSMVYVPAGETQGELLSKNLGLNLILDSLPFMSPACQATYGSFWCRSRMRRCEMVTDVGVGKSFPVAQLICRADCALHATDCLVDYEKTFAKSYLGGIATARGSIVTSPSCDRLLEPSDMRSDPEIAWFMYRHGGEVEYTGIFPLLSSVVNPRISAGQDMYPVERTVYDDGSVGGFAVPCMRLSAGTQSGSSVSCPSPLVVNSELGMGEDLCALPCPSFIYTTTEYLSIMSVLSIPGVMGVAGNFYMVVAHLFAGKALRKDITVEVKWAAFAGMLWGVISPLPSAILFTDMTCANECATENCASEGGICAVNRNAVFLLQFIQFLFTNVVTTLYIKTTSNGTPSTFQKKLMRGLYYASFIIPSALMILSNILHTDDPSVPNAAVNAIRDSFTCYPHLANAGTEFALIFAPFLVGGTLTVYSVARVTHTLLAAERSNVKVASVQSETNAQANVESRNLKITQLKEKNLNSKSHAVRRKLIAAGALVSILLIANTAGTMITLPIMEDFGKQEYLWFECVKINTVSQNKETDIESGLMNCFVDKCPDLIPEFDFKCPSPHTMSHCVTTGATSDFAGFLTWYDKEDEITTEYNLSIPELVGTEINGDQDLIRLGLCDGLEGSPTCNFNYFSCFVKGCRKIDAAEQMAYFTTSVPCPDKPKLRPSPYVLAINAFAHSCCSLLIFMMFGTHDKYKAIWASILKKYVMRDTDAKYTVQMMPLAHIGACSGMTSCANNVVCLKS